jgi:hypothetical protein
VLGKRGKKIRADKCLMKLRLQESKETMLLLPPVVPEKVVVVKTKFSALTEMKWWSSKRNSHRKKGKYLAIVLRNFYKKMLT